MSKLTKFLKSPTLYFYDLLRKRIYGDDISIEPGLGQKLSDIDKFVDIEAVEKCIKKLAKFCSRGVLYFDDRVKLFAFICQISYFLKYDIKIITSKGQNVYSKKIINFYEIMKSASKYNSFHIEIFNNECVKTFYAVIGEMRGQYFVSDEDTGVKKIHKKNFKNAKVEFDFPIDVVYTYVDSNDPDWISLWNATFESKRQPKDRFEVHDELKYSMRSIHTFMPWVNRIFIVSNCPKPEWLTLSDRVRWIMHEEIFPDTSCLPVFNSHAIEACLHRIPDLSEHYIYFNDDVFVNRELYPTDFFYSRSISLNFRENYEVAFWTPETIDEIGYQSATIQVQNLLRKDFDYTPRYMMQHTPHAMQKSVMEDLDERYSKQFTATRSHKIRHVEDISSVSFLYPHYAFIHGRSLHINERAAIVRDTNYDKIISENYKYTFLCFNSWYDDNYSVEVKKFFNERYFMIPGWEAGSHDE